MKSTVTHLVVRAPHPTIVAELVLVVTSAATTTETIVVTSVTGQQHEEADYGDADENYC